MVLAHDLTKGNRTRDVKTTQNITFETMLLAPNTMQGLKDSGFYKPSPIQLCGIPIGKCGFDLLLEAKSGTGKTAVFSIIALEKLDFTKGLQVVILTPTREIAAQICDVLKQIGAKYKDLQIEVVMGGLPFQEDIEKFQKTVHIVVGSPGRLKHLIQKNHIDTTAVRLLILDEADKLMEKSFQPDIRFIHTALPNQKQVIMSSATYSDTAKTFINNYVKNANHVCPDSNTVLIGVTQKVSFVKYNSNIVKQTQDKFKELLHILVKVQFKQCLVFCNYQARVSEIHKLLKKEKWPSEQLYGQQEQVDRLDALKTLQQYKCRILVSTDLASRGIDASNIDLVVNFEPPHDWQTYLHRIGRAGRFGSYGLAITIVSEGKEQQSFKDMFKSMDLSISMRNFWTDEEFNLNNSVIHTDVHNSPNLNNVLDSSKEESQEAVWDLLSSQSYETNALETFESLCKSEEKSETKKIDKFSDLMLSLESNDCQDKEENYSFKHIEIKKSSTTPITPKVKCVSLSNPIVTNNINVLINKLKNDKLNDSTEGTTDVHNIDDKDSNYCMGETGKYLKEVIPHTVSNINLNNDFKCEHSDTKSLVLYYKQSTMLSDSELTSNNTSKAQNKPIHSNDISNDNEAVSIKEHDLNSFGDNSKPNGEDISYHSHTTEDDDYYDETKNSNKKKSRSFNPTQDTGGSFEVQDDDYNHIDTKSHSSKYSVEKHKQKTKLYYDWYNQLKINTQWLEQSIYVDEMSRM